MTVPEIIEWIRAKEERIKGEAIEFAEQHLPQLEKLAQTIAANPAVAAIANAEHLNEVPELLESFAQEVQRIDVALGNAKAAGAAKALADQAAAAAQPAEQAS